jgi:ribose 5-phosphate isomerase B
VGFTEFQIRLGDRRDVLPVDLSIRSRRNDFNENQGKPCNCRRFAGERSCSADGLRLTSAAGTLADPGQANTNHSGRAIGFANSWYANSWYDCAMSDTVAIAADHGGFDLKASLVAVLEALGVPALDLGTSSREAVDYPDFADALAAALMAGRAQRGILVCGSGIGMSIAANRHPGIRAALCHDGLTARLARQHNDANVLVLGGRLIGIETARDCLTTFLNTPFEGGRHARRVAKLTRTVPQ